MPEPPLPQLDLSRALAVMEEEKTELDKVLELLLDPRNIQHNTELSKNEITAFSILGPIGTAYDLPVLKAFLAENLVLRVSKGRAGRKEWVKIVSRPLQMAEEMPGQNPSGFGRFFGGRRKP